MRPMQPDGLPHRMKPRVTAPESTFTAEEANLRKLLTDLDGQNFYQRLGLDRHNVTDDDVKKAKHRKSIDFFPDNKPEKLREIYGEIYKRYTEALNALKDADRRSVYDAKTFRPKSEVKPTTMEEFKMNFMRLRMTDRGLKKSARETFDDLRKMYAGKLTEEDMQREREKWITEGVVTKEEAKELQLAA